MLKFLIIFICALFSAALVIIVLPILAERIGVHLLSEGLDRTGLPIWKLWLISIILGAGIGTKIGITVANRIKIKLKR